MAKTIQFRGGPRFKPGHAYPTPPLIGPIKTRQATDFLTGKPAVDEDGKPIMETVTGWEVGDTVTFDRPLAEFYGRVSTSDPEDDGDEWAQLHLDAWNNGAKKGEEPFIFVGPGSKGGKGKPKQSDESVSVTGGSDVSLADAPPAVTPPVDAAGAK